jgi:hypothetical protein
MKNPAPKSVVLALFTLIGLVWGALTLYALAKSFLGGNPFTTVVIGPAFALHMTLFGKVYLVTSGLMPFVVLGAIALA